MTAIGSRFGLLLVNAENPYDRSQKKSKTKKKVESRPSDAKKKSHTPPKTENVAQVDSIAPEKVTSSQKNKVEVVITDVSTSKTEEVKAVKNVPAKQVTKQEKGDGKKTSDSKSKPTESKTSTSSKSGPSKPDQVPTQNQPEKQSEQRKGDVSVTQEELEKDSRGKASRTAYRRVMVSRGRVYDRHGGEKSRVKVVEKKHGHGAYNWGEADTGVDDSVVSEKDKEKENDSEAKSEKKVKPVVQFTLAQYKEMIKENRVDPSIWENQVEEVAQENPDADDDDDIREYQFNPREYDSRRSRGSEGRGRRFSRGGRFQERSRAGSSYRSSASYRSRGSDNVKDVKIDDTKDFPEL